MKDYRYRLDTTSRKHLCPKCGRKSYVLYIDTSTGCEISPYVGRCDRKDNCNWHYTPAEFFRDHLRPYNAYQKSNQNPLPQYKKPSYIPSNMIRATIERQGNNSLRSYLHSLFDPITGAEVVNRALMAGAVGTSTLFGGSPIFWQVDHRGGIRTGKVMGYDPDTGKRIKNPRPLMQWVHSLLRDPGYNLKQCFYGAHRSIGNDKVLWIFESEKTALIVSIILIWLKADSTFTPIATGGCEGLNPTDDKFKDPWDKHQVLKGRQIVLFPDNGKYEDWSNKSRGLIKHCRNVYVSDVMEFGGLADRAEGIDPGDDMGDVIVRYIKAGRSGAEMADLFLKSY